MKNINKWQYLSALLGNVFEHYDKALLSFLSPFLATTLFPGKDPIVALLLTYGMIPLGMLARPVGSLVFGYIGDVYGRKQALFLSLGGMGVLSLFIACIPTYGQMGFLIPVLFCVARVLQNFFSAGETMGGAIFLLEKAEDSKQDILSSIFNSSTIGGILLASAAISLLTFFDVIEGGWRFLFLLGTLTAVFGLIVRKKLPEETAKEVTVSRVCFRKLFWEYKRPLLILIISSGFNYANYSIALVLINGYVPLVSSVSKEQMIHLNTALLVLDFFALPLFGYLSSKISREKMMIAASMSVVVLAFPLFNLLINGSMFSVIMVRIILVVLGVAFSASYHAWAKQMIPKEHRYTLISFGYAVGSQLLGGSTAAISLWIYHKTGMASSICWYWMVLAAICSITLLSVQKPYPVKREV